MPSNVACAKAHMLAILRAVKDSDHNQQIFLGIDGVDHDVWRVAHHPFIAAVRAAGMADIRIATKQFGAVEYPFDHRMGGAGIVVFDPGMNPVEVGVGGLADA
jgi:hypothetical protein